MTRKNHDLVIVGAGSGNMIPNPTRSTGWRPACSTSTPPSPKPSNRPCSTCSRHETGMGPARAGFPTQPTCLRQPTEMNRKEHP